VDVALNWLWQGALIAAATALVLRAIGPGHPRARYRLVWAAALSVALVPLAGTMFPGAATQIAPSDAVAASALISLPPRWWTSDAAALSLWALWMMATAAYAACALGAMRRVTRATRPIADADEARLPHWLEVRGSGRPARLGVSEAVKSAAVLGGRPPVIAIAPDLLKELGDADLDRVVIHEWAHVQRRDDWSVVLGLAVRIVVGWHPAIWWLERRLHAEREAACDELVIGVTGSAKAYAGCLTRLASLQRASLRPLPAVGVAASALRERIVRILTPRPAMSAWQRALAAGATVIPFALALAVSGVPVVHAATVVAEVRSMEDTARAGTLAAIEHVGMGRDRRVTAAAAPTSTPGPSPNLSARVARQAERPAPTVSTPAPQTDTAAAAAAGDDSPAALVSSTPTVPLDSAFTSSAPALGTAPALAPASPPPDEPTLWGAAAEGGTAIGRGSQKAAVATAGFLTRMSKKIAGSF
jgi:beta-lactamase regulating signal transducer with metallopeptidase domain